MRGTSPKELLIGDMFHYQGETYLCTYKALHYITAAMVHKNRIVPASKRVEYDMNMDDLEGNIQILASTFPETGVGKTPSAKPPMRKPIDVTEEDWNEYLEEHGWAS